MPREEPFFKKCCYCIPLKSCLQAWSCVKVIADLSIAVFLTCLVILLSDRHMLTTDHFTLAHLFLIFIGLLVVDSLFIVVLTVALWTKNLKTLRVFYYYSIYMVFMGAACLVGLLTYSITIITTIPNNVILVISSIVCGIINIGLDVCIIFTLKSEMIKLRNKEQYEFVQMPTLDPEEESREQDSFEANVENFDA